MEVTKPRPGIMTFRHQYDEFYKSDDNYLYWRSPKTGVFEIERTAEPELKVEAPLTPKKPFWKLW